MRHPPDHCVESILCSLVPRKTNTQPIMISASQKQAELSVAAVIQVIVTIPA